MTEMKYKLKPYKHQLEAVNLATLHPNLALFWEMGTGKTGGMINILRLRYNSEKKIMKTIILAPVITLQNWKDEFGIHSNVKQQTIEIINKTGKQLQKQLDNMGDKSIIITNYEKLLNKDLQKFLANWNPEILVCDESHYLKSHNSKRTKEAVKIADHCRFKFILTGTPILNNSLDVFSQYRVLDGGETFGKNFYTFRGTYFVDRNAGWKGKQNYFPDFRPNPKKDNELKDKIFRKALRVRKEECLDLPPLVKQRVPVELSKEQARAYREMRDDFVTILKDGPGKDKAAFAQLAITKAIRLQQILTGFVKTDAGENHIFSGTNPRIKILIEHLEQLVPEHKVIVWCNFRQNHKMISDAIDEKLKGVKYVKINGEMSYDDKQESVRAFRKDDDVRIVIANQASAGIGINLVEASYSITYSRSFSLGEELQAEARNHRGGSQIHERITKIDLHAPGTIDEAILAALDQKRKTSENLIDSNDRTLDLFQQWVDNGTI